MLTCTPGFPSRCSALYKAGKSAVAKKGRHVWRWEAGRDKRSSLLCLSRHPPSSDIVTNTAPALPGRCNSPSPKFVLSFRLKKVGLWHQLPYPTSQQPCPAVCFRRSSPTKQGQDLARRGREVKGVGGDAADTRFPSAGVCVLGTSGPVFARLVGLQHYAVSHLALAAIRCQPFLALDHGGTLRWRSCRCLRASGSCTAVLQHSTPLCVWPPRCGAPTSCVETEALRRRQATMAELQDLQDAPIGTEVQRGKEVWAGTVALGDGQATWSASAQCWTSGHIGRVWGLTGAATARGGANSSTGCLYAAETSDILTFPRFRGPMHVHWVFWKLCAACVSK